MPQTTSTGPSGSSLPAPTEPARRQSIKGLPPKHLGHLRGLVQQWISQQKKNHGGMPGGPSFTGLWSESRGTEILDAISKGLLTTHHTSGRQSLLDIDWSDWAAKSWRRRDAWKQEQTDLAKRKQKETVDRSTLRFLKRASQSDADVQKRGRQLSVGTPTAIASLMTSTVSTPARQPSRPASIASSAKSIHRSDEFSEQLTAGLYKTMTGTSDGSSLSDEMLYRWCDGIKGLQGYEPLKLDKQDEWEVVRGKPSEVSLADK
jgi:1-phosphatidylinositol-3-phosphate 5-kinase